jgi:hypothetical protein
VQGGRLLRIILRKPAIGAERPANLQFSVKRRHEQS